MALTIIECCTAGNHIFLPAHAATFTHRDDNVSVVKPVPNTAPPPLSTNEDAVTTLVNHLCITLHNVAQTNTAETGYLTSLNIH